MAFSPVPSETKSKIRRAGDILIKNRSTSIEFKWARDLANRWRACHAYPINTFQANLRNKLKKFHDDPIAAQRLKRMPTIIDKLKRYPSMNLTTMQDIGGVRAILGSVEDVYSLADEFLKSRRLTHELIEKKDYIVDPRSEDGYRSIHLIYKYKNKLAPSYNGLRLELQIRTKLQHTWATAVETMGTFLGQALKSRQGDQEWLNFFAAVSSAFAYKESCTPVPRFSHLSRVGTYKAVSDAENQLRALEKMNAFSVAVDFLSKKKDINKRWSYHLIILNSLKHTVKINAYDRNSFNQAMIDYGKVEEEVAKGKKIEPVLVSAGPIDKIRIAYPNFFLDIKDFVEIVTDIIRDTREMESKTI